MTIMSKPISCQIGPPEHLQRTHAAAAARACESGSGDQGVEASASMATGATAWRVHDGGRGSLIGGGRAQQEGDQGHQRQAVQQPLQLPRPPAHRPCSGKHTPPRAWPEIQICLCVMKHSLADDGSMHVHISGLRFMKRSLPGRNTHRPARGSRAGPPAAGGQQVSASPSPGPP